VPLSRGGDTDNNYYDLIVSINLSTWWWSLYVAIKELAHTAYTLINNNKLIQYKARAII